MNKRRLLKLAKFLDDNSKVIGRKFCMETWAVDQFAPGAAKRGYSCQTAACAVGWATAIPSLRRAGLRLNSNLEICYGGDENFPAVSKFFGIGEYEARVLFSPETYRSGVRPRTIARVIRRFAEEKCLPRVSKHASALFVAYSTHNTPDPWEDLFEPG
jgi:hypothetical protein